MMLRSYVLALPIASAMLLSSCNSAKTGSAPKLETDESKAIYAIGLSMGNSLASLKLTPAELEIVKQGITDQVDGKPAVEIETYGPKIEPMLRERQGKLAVGEREKGKAYEDKMAAETGAQRMPSGLIYKEIKAGTGAQPKETDVVTVNYRGTLMDGKEFDSSAKHGGPQTFPLNGVIPCWTEGVQKLKVGGKAQLVCPADIAYRDSGQGDIPPGATLTFEVELVETKAQ